MCDSFGVVFSETDPGQFTVVFANCRRGCAPDTGPWEPRGLLLRDGNWAAGRGAAASWDSDLEAFSRNPTHGSFAPLAFQPSAMTNCANRRFLSY